jgi:L-fuconolactonase
MSVELTGVIDSHVHIGADSYGPIERYRATIDRLELRGAVLVARQWQFDNTELIEAMASDDRFRVVGAVDLTAPDADAALGRWLDAGIVGLRADPAWLVGDPDASIWRRIAHARLLVSFTPHVDTLASRAFRVALEVLGDCAIRIEHLGGLRPAEIPLGDDRAVSILRLADRPNVVTMWSGFWLNAGSPWPYPTADQLLRSSLDAFGPDRMCWSGDWNRPAPPVGSHITDGDYTREAHIVRRIAGGDADAILKTTATRLFKLSV